MRLPRGIVSIRVRIRDRFYTIRFMPARAMNKDWGRCYFPPGRHPLIEVRRTLTGRNMIDTIAHEVLHACQPDMSEQGVEETAGAIARALYAAGCRMTRNLNAKENQ